MSNKKTTFGAVKIGGRFETRPGWGFWEKRSERTAVKVDGQAFEPHPWDAAEPVWIEEPE